MTFDLNASDFQPGDHVIYVPGHAHGDRNHPDCERGVVSSVNEAGTVFVKFRADAVNGQACDAKTLILDRRP